MIQLKNFKMYNISDQIVEDFLQHGVNTFFGEQESACLRLIENVVKFKEKYKVLRHKQHSLSKLINYIKIKK